MSDRYHAAARAGWLEVLQEARREQLNSADEDGMTPALWAAYHGHMAALKLIVARGGDPDHADLWGNTPLHLAAAHGHQQCVAFLVAFGVNIWSLDNDHHTALDAAAALGRMDCVRLLDAAAAKQMTLKPKLVSKLKERAFRAAERRIRDCARVQRRHRRRQERRFMKEAAMLENTDAMSLSSYGSNSTGHASYSQVALQSSKGGALLQRKVQRRRQDHGAFRVSEDGRRSVRSLSGLALGNEVLFLRPERRHDVSDGEPPLRRPHVRHMFHPEDAVSVATSDTSVSRAMSDPGLWEAAESEVSADSGRDSLFNRPGLGTVVFRRTYGPRADQGREASGHAPNGHAPNGYDSSGHAPNGYDSNMPRRGRLRVTDPVPALVPAPVQEQRSSPDSDLGSVSVEGNWEQDQEQFLSSPLEVFMASVGLQDLTSVFTREGLDLEDLVLSTEEDLAHVQIPLGPRKRLLDALNRRLEVLQLTAGPLEDTAL